MVAEQRTTEASTVPTTSQQHQSHAHVDWSVKGVVSTGAMLLFGTATAVLTKAGTFTLRIIHHALVDLTTPPSIAYELEAVGRYGVVEHFEKPWALTAVMFLGMSLCLPVAYYHKLRDQDEHQQHMHAGPVQQPILRRVRGVL